MLLIRAKCKNPDCSILITTPMRDDAGGRPYRSGKILELLGWSYSQAQGGWLCPECTKALCEHNPEALQELIRAARLLSKYPVCGVANFDDTCCAHCGALGEYDDLLDESIHKDYCPWRLLKEALANLYNPGYSVKGDLT